VEKRAVYQGKNDKRWLQNVSLLQYMNFSTPHCVPAALIGTTELIKLMENEPEKCKNFSGWRRQTIGGAKRRRS
jgi:hypothetical protein